MRLFTVLKVKKKMMMMIKVMVTVEKVLAHIHTTQILLACYVLCHISSLNDVVLEKDKEDLNVRFLLDVRCVVVVVVVVMRAIVLRTYARSVACLGR